MKISIITVVYNSEETIECTIKSVLEQNYKSVEYIIIDGGSTDKTLNIIDAYKPSISHVISEKDNGIYDAMNKGILLASGDVIGILNSDDLYFDNGVLSEVARCFEENVDLKILYGNIFYVKKEDILSTVRCWNSMSYYEGFFEDGNVPPHPSVFVKSEVYKHAGLYQDRYSLAADYEFLLRSMKRYKFPSLYLDKVMVRMRLGGESNKSFKNIFKANTEVLKAWRDNGYIPPLLLVPRRVIKRFAQFF